MSLLRFSNYLWNTICYFCNDCLWEGQMTHYGCEIFDKTIQACQGPTSFIAYERGLLIFEYSHVFRSGGSLVCTLPCTFRESQHFCDKLKHRCKFWPKNFIYGIVWNMHHILYECCVEYWYCVEYWFCVECWYCVCGILVPVIRIVSLPSSFIVIKLGRAHIIW
jgi:hypothetical protein